ncbi:hypothetical protein JIG36_24215 [Actinoplanes sp. LDG1-06]|uniref:Uncharacterized protein n=1 Tax=Paractinoplanes ovalisporus TaxID=2810368 RepID=A0ABS2AFS8_9ACTN|nr:hypothetical protein [Actinoplanes ovalisporus]MBM2618667.1 hypothetical protein [Actinoplanes ovalisporus]
MVAGDVLNLLRGAPETVAAAEGHGRQQMTLAMIAMGAIPGIALVVLLGRLGARTKSIRITTPVGQLLVEFGLTADEIAVEKLRLLVEISSRVSDAEFRSLALVTLSDYLRRDTAPGPFDPPTPNRYQLPTMPPPPFGAGRTIDGSAYGAPNSSGDLWSPPPPGY